MSVQSVATVLLRGIENVPAKSLLWIICAHLIIIMILLHVRIPDSTESVQITVTKYHMGRYMLEMGPAYFLDSLRSTAFARSPICVHQNLSSLYFDS